jgi:glucosamine--fructose-6-phosphate aminotransferase (isomerizing)
MNKTLLENPYFNDILHQPEAVSDTALFFEKMDFSGFRSYAQALAAGKYKRVVLTGMGSSFHALNPLYLRLIAQDIPVVMVETSELIHYAPRLLSPEALVVAVSQSGRSVEILQMLDLLPKQASLISLTNTADSPLARQSEAVLLTQAGVEYNVSCKTYVAALAALAVLGDLLLGQSPVGTLNACKQTAALMTGYLSHWEDFIDHLVFEMAGVKHLILAGRGSSLAAVGTGGLIIKESAHFHSEGMSCAAFRHGPFEMLSPEMFVMVYQGGAPTRQYNANLVRDIQQAGGRAELVVCGEAKNVFTLPDASESTLPLLEILPAQLFSIALAVLNRHTPGQFERGSKVTEIA